MLLPEGPELNAAPYVRLPPPPKPCPLAVGAFAAPRSLRGLN
jgi:hypothetical protein